MRKKGLRPAPIPRARGTIPAVDIHARLRYIRRVGARHDPLCFHHGRLVREDTIRKITVSLLGAAVLAAGLLLVRKQEEAERPTLVPAGERVPATISLERIRELQAC